MLAFRVKVIKETKNSVEKYLAMALKTLTKEKLEKIAADCLQYFVMASPTEEVAKNWSYEVVSEKNKLSLFFNNSFVKNGVNIAIIIDIGHGTSTGKWVPGQHYLKEPIQKTYDTIIERTWEALKNYER